MKRNKGFSLIELLIVVAIVGILAAIAYPSYQSHIMKTRRSDGQAPLLDVAARQERYFFDNGAYTDDLKELGLVKNANDPMDTPEGDYSITIDAEVVGTCELDSCYVATATRKTALDEGKQEDDKCGDLTLDSKGNKGIKNADAGVEAEDCW